MGRPPRLSAGRVLTLSALLAAASALHQPGPSPEERTAAQLEREVDSASGGACDALPRDHVLVRVGDKELPNPFKSCAIVGSGASLLMNRDGKKIDGHDTVIRLNRLPSGKEDPEQIGSRTDVYYQNALGDYDDGNRSNTFVRVRYSGNVVKDGLWEPCNVESGKGACNNFTSLVWSGWNLGGRFLGIHPMNRTAFPFAHQSQALHHFCHGLPAIGKTRPSCGMKAIFTFGLLCKSLDVYGFGMGDDSSTFDKHRIPPHDHLLGEEHRIQRLLASGEVPDKDWTPLNYGAKYEKEIAAFRAKLQCMGAKGLIHFH